MRKVIFLLLGGCIGIGAAYALLRPSHKHDDNPDAVGNWLGVYRPPANGSIPDTMYIQPVNMDSLKRAKNTVVVSGLKTSKR